MGTPTILIPTDLLAIEIRTIHRGHPLEIVKVAFRQVLVPETYAGAGGVGQTEGTIHHPGIHVIGISVGRIERTVPTPPAPRSSMFIVAGIIPGRAAVKGPTGPWERPFERFVENGRRRQWLWV